MRITTPAGKRWIRILWNARISGPALAILMLGACAGGEPARLLETPPSASAPDIVLITLDTTRADRIGAYGYDPAETPHLDALAEEGVLFERAWSTMPLTTPAHASIMTGLYPAGHGVRNNFHYTLPEAAETLAERLRREGYATGGFVGAFPVSRTYGFHQGFETFSDEMGSDIDGTVRSERIADEVNAQALPWLRQVLSSKDRPPVFLWLHYYDPHLEYTPPPPFWEEFSSRPYDGEIAYVDDRLGRILTVIREEGDWNNTVVAVAGDHGEGLGEHGERSHGLLVYESTLHVPMILCAPGRLPAGRRDDRLVSIVDLHPTLLAVAGLAVPAGLHGQDLTLLREEPPSSSEPWREILERRGEERVVMAESLYPWEELGWASLFAIRRDDTKWIQGGGRELYRLGEDSTEKRNRIEDAERRERELSEILEALLLRMEESGLAAAEVEESDAAERLQSLGYVGGSAGRQEKATEPAGGDLTDPAGAVEDYETWRMASEALKMGPRACQRTTPMLRNLVLKYPETVAFRLDLARSLMCVEQPGAAESEVLRILSQDEDNQAALWLLSNIYFARGMTGRGLETARRAHEEGADEPGSDKNLVLALLRADEAGEAEALVDRTLDRRPEDAEWQCLKGRILEKQGDPEAAMRIYETVLSQEPAEPRAYLRVLDLLAEEDRLEEARAKLAQWLERAPLDPGLQRQARRFGVPVPTRDREE